MPTHGFYLAEGWFAGQRHINPVLHAAEQPICMLNAHESHEVVWKTCLCVEKGLCTLSPFLAGVENERGPAGAVL